ncbi:MAG: endonuclease/exonuclease/phosphatase family protein [Sumerlaeia bacterium]
MFDLSQPIPGCRVFPDGRVAFAAAAPGARRVLLAGDFTHWGAGALAMGPDPSHPGEWTLTLDQPLAPGLYFYKYIVDDVWRHDELNPIREADPFGGSNSVFVVGGREDLGPPEALRVMTLNLHTWQELESHLKLRQTAFVLAALDVHAVLLQEVGAHREDPLFANAGGALQALLEMHTGRTWHHAWRFAHESFRHFDEGLSLMSCLPLEDVEAVELSGGDLRRIALGAVVRHGGRRVRLAAAHLNWPWTSGPEEAAALLRWIEEREAASPTDGVLVGGDFNATTDDEQVRVLTDAGFLDVARHCAQARHCTPKPTMGEGERGMRIDFQFLRSHGPGRLRPEICRVAFEEGGWGGVFQPRVSDHAGVFAVYR